MELSPHLAALRTDLSAAAAVGGEDAARAAALLADAVEPALRLVLMELLSEAASELSEQVPGLAVELRLRGRDPELVAAVEHAPEVPAEPLGEDTARLTLRLPEALKARAEAAAAAEGLSTNSWLVRAVSAGLEPSYFRGPRGGGPRRLQGYGRA